MTTLKMQHICSWVLLLVFFFFSYALSLAAQETSKPAIASVEERRLLSTIEKNKKNVPTGLAVLEKRKIELKTLEGEVDKKLNELKKIRQEIRQLLAIKDDAEAAEARNYQEQRKKRIKTLSKIYEKMDPTKVTAILNALDEDLALALLSNMKKKSIAAIMEILTLEKNSRLATLFTAPPRPHKTAP